MLRAYIFVVIIVTSILGFSAQGQSSQLDEYPRPGFGGVPYVVDAFIQSAIVMQSVDYATALERLHSMAQRKDNSRNEVFILCRMLFTQRGGAGFRGPGLGQDLFIGCDCTNYGWPLEPIELVDGVPFLISKGYLLAGIAESPEQYLDYCETNCSWSGFRYEIKTDQQEIEALNRLLYSLNLKKRLSESDVDFLKGQILPTMLPLLQAGMRKPVF
jgi:hypothetical protein